MEAPSRSLGDPTNSTTVSHPAGPWFAVLALVGLAAVTVSAGQFTSGVNVVEVYASVTDAQGQPVKGLTKGDFDLREDGTPQQIATFAAGQFPLSVAVAVDRSFSMAGERLESAKSAALVFLHELRPSDEAMVLAVGSQVEVVASLSTDRAAQTAGVSGLDAFGTTGLYDAIMKGIDAVQGAKGRRALVLFSDGDDRYSDTSVQAVLDRARRSDVMIYAVALGRSRPPVFAELATITGGRSFFVREARTLPDVARGIAHELREQYLLGYTPSTPIVAGRNVWRSITVTVRRPGLQVRARDGYLVK